MQYTAEDVNKLRELLAQAEARANKAEKRAGKAEKRADKAENRAEKAENGKSRLGWGITPQPGVKPASSRA